MTDLWVSDRPVFRGTTVLACVPVVRIGASGGPGPDDWGRLAAPYFGIPDADLPTSSGRVGDLGGRARRTSGTSTTAWSRTSATVVSARR